MEENKRKSGNEFLQLDNCSLIIDHCQLKTITRVLPYNSEILK